VCPTFGINLQLGWPRDNTSFDLVDQLEVIGTQVIGIVVPVVDDSQLLHGHSHLAVHPPLHAIASACEHDRHAHVGKKPRSGGRLHWLVVEIRFGHSNVREECFIFFHLDPFQTGGNCRLKVHQPHLAV